MRLPFALDHVNLLLCDDGDSWTLLDTGYGDTPTRAVWERLLEGLLAGRPIRRVIGTHFHPDHVGLAGWLCDATGAELLMSRTEWLTCRALALDDTDGFVAASERNYRRARLDEEVVAAAAAAAQSLPQGSERAAGHLSPGSLPAIGSSWRAAAGGC